MSRFWIFASKITCLVDFLITSGIPLDIEKLSDHTEAVSFHNFWRLILVQHFVLLSHQDTIFDFLGSVGIMYFYKSLKQIIIAIIMPATKEKRKTAVLQLSDHCWQAIALSESPALGAKVEGRIDCFWECGAVPSPGD